MTHRVIFAPEAQDQLGALFDYIAREASPDIALDFTEAVVAYCRKFASYPRRGTRRDDLRPGLRTVGFRRRLTIAFAVDEDTVTILGVYYGGQDFETRVRRN